MKSTKIAEVNGNNIIRVEKEVKVQKKTLKFIDWVVSKSYDNSKPEGNKWSLGHYFTSLYEAARYAEKKNAYYQLTISDKYSEFELQEGESDKLYYIFDYYEDAVKKAEEFLKENEIPNTEEIIQELREKNEVEYEEYKPIKIEEYYLGERINY